MLDKMANNSIKLKNSSLRINGSNQGVNGWRSVKGETDQRETCTLEQYNLLVAGETIKRTL